MAISFVATTGNSWNFNNPVTSQTRAFNVGAGSNRFLTVTVLGDVAATSGVSGVTYAGVAMTKLATVRVGTDRAMDLWYLANPTSGSNNVVITRSSSGLIISGFNAYAGVDQTTPIPNFSTGTVSPVSSAFSASLTTTETDSWIGAAVRDNTGRNLSESGWTERCGNDTTGYGMHAGDTNATVSVGGNTLTGTFSGTCLQAWILFEIAEAGAAPTFVKPNFLGFARL